jgi:hypothetical protein
VRGRDRGKRKEAELYGLWGGKPSTVKLRHRDATINAHSKVRYHGNAHALMPGVKFPDPSEEGADAAAADSAYEEFGDVLCERTRDSSEFPLVFKEPINYGFRCKLWGWKREGIVLSRTALVLLCGLLVWSARRALPLTSLVGALIVDACILLVGLRDMKFITKLRGAS